MECNKMGKGSKRKRWVPWLVCLTVLILLLVLVPFPSRLNKHLTGLCMKDSGTGQQEAEASETGISIKGRRLNYLFRKDRLKGTVTIHPYPLEETNQAVYDFMMSLVYIMTDDQMKQLVSIMRYSPAKNAYTGGYLFFNKDMTKIMVQEDSDRLYSAPANTNKKALAIRNYFKE